jgi:pimeloyl-ACP methyl ester carboxylesterase
MANLRLRLHPVVAAEDRVRDLFFTADTDAAIVATTTDRVGDESYRAYLEMLFRRPRATRVLTPVRIVVGDRDRLMTVRDARRTARSYGTEPVVVKDAGHNLMLDPRWEEVAEAIAAFAAEVS